MLRWNFTQRPAAPGTFGGTGWLWSHWLTPGNGTGLLNHSKLLAVHPVGVSTGVGEGVKPPGGGGCFVIALPEG